MKVFLIVISCFVFSISSFSQQIFDLTGIWLSEDYRCSEGNVGIGVAQEVFKIDQDVHGFVSAMKCIGDKCVPAGEVSWNGNIADSIIDAWFTIGAPGCPSCGHMSVRMKIVSNGLITSDNGMHYKKISCDDYKRVIQSKYNTYYDCKLCAEDFEIPNVFTPNKDGVNDVWTFFLPQNFSILNFEIYDRWGVLNNSVKKDLPKDNSRNSSGAWDGKSMGGAPCNSGVYFYVIKYVDGDNEFKSKTGSINLFRD